MQNTHTLASFLLAFILLFAQEAAAQSKPLRVFILAGQSNMEGHAEVRTFDYIGKVRQQHLCSRRCAIPMERLVYVRMSGCPI